MQGRASIGRRGSFGLLMAAAVVVALTAGSRMRGSALNAIDGQTSNFWHTEWGARQPNYPHQLVIDLGASLRVGGFRYTPRADNPSGRIKGYRAYVGDGLTRSLK
jgi:hypothetical protein